MNVAPGYPFARTPPTEDLSRGGVLAVSATDLQGTQVEAGRALMAQLRALAPIDVINGTVYLYAVPGAVER